MRRSHPDFNSELALRTNVSRLMVAATRSFTVSGRIPLDPSTLVLFFRSKSGITHSLDFPIDVDFDTPPALDVLYAACRVQPSTPDYDDYHDREALFYPTNLPLTATLELANHPVLDAIRNTLFPSLPAGHYLTAVRDKLELLSGGGRMGPQLPTKDGRVATIVVTLPVRFRGGALVVRDAEDSAEKFHGRGGKTGDMEWTAFLADCVYEVETVQKGCRMTISYGVHLRTFGPSGIQPDPLITPSEGFLDTLSSVLNICRGRKIAFYLQCEYGVNPSQVLAESLVASLKGGDSLLYHAIKLYKLTPELHWYAGGYIWPMDRLVEVGSENPDTGAITFGASRKGLPAVRGAFSAYGESEEDMESLRVRVEDSGAVPLEEAGITILSDWQATAPISKERVPFVSNGQLEKLVVNVLLVTYVP